MEFRSTTASKSRTAFKNTMKKNEIKELKKTVAYLENYLIQVSDERDRTLEKLKESIELSETLEVKLKYEQKSKQPLKEEINQLHQEITSLNLKIFTQQEQSSQIFQEHSAANSKLQSEIVKLNELFKMATEESLAHRDHNEKLASKLKVIFKTIQLPKSCLKEILDPNLGVSKTKEYILKIPKIYNENHRLKEENRELFSQIGKFESVHDASEFQSLIKDSQGLNFFKNRTACGKQFCAAHPTATSNWIPKPIYSALEDFRNKNDAITSNAVISLFCKLNQIWQERENNRIERIKKQYGVKGTCSETNSIMKKHKSQTTPGSQGKIRELITKEFKVVSEQIIKIIFQYFNETDRSSITEDSQNQLCESILSVFAEYTDRILMMI